MSRYFTVEQANAMLPLVRRIARDIVEAHGAWQRLVREFEVATAHSRAELPAPRAEELQREVQRLAHEIQGFVQELRDLDVEFKGFEAGLVDFPCLLEGREVSLCWKLGEDAVTHWHEVGAGFAGRQPLIPLMQAS